LQVISTLFATVKSEGILDMRAKDRKLLRRRLDEEMKPFRGAGREPNPTNGLLRAVRQALRIPLAEIAEKSGVGRSTVNDFEMRELKRTITLKSLGRMAEAMGCKVVYGVVPVNGRRFLDLEEERLWTKVLGAGTREQ